MKYLVTITLIALSINAFSMDKYVVCMEKKLLFITVNMQSPKLTTLPKCVNDYMEKGYVPLSGLHAVVTRGNYWHKYYFQALLRE